MALVRDEYWLKLAGQERSRKKGRAGKLWRIEKSEEMGFKARKKLITRKIECSARLGWSRAGNCGGVVCVQSKGS